MSRGPNRIDALLERGWVHFAALCAFVLALHGRAIAYGLIYDDAALLTAPHRAWLAGPWYFDVYYRPLQALLFTPWLVSRSAPLLHVQNLIVGALIVFLFGRLLRRLGLGARTTFVVELLCLALPTSMMLLVWISQRTEWPTLLIGLALLLMTFTAWGATVAYVLVFALLGAMALLFKETGVAVLAAVPLFVWLHHHRQRQALALAVTAAAVLVMGLAVRSLIVMPVASTAKHPGFELTLSAVETLVYPWLQVCFTYAPWILALDVTFLGLAVVGLVAMLGEARAVAGGLIAIFVAYAAAVVKLPEPRNLVMPAFVVAAFAVYGTAAALRRERPIRGMALAVVLVINLGVLAGLSVTSASPLQARVVALNEAWERAHPHDVPRGYVHEIDANTRFRLALRERLRDVWYRGKPPATTRAALP